MPDIISRKEAIALGLNRYFTGKTCPRGHVEERRVGSKGCVACERECALGYYTAHKEQCRASHKAWAEANPDRKRAAYMAWYEANADRKRAADRAWYEANADRARAAARAWREANPSRARAADRAWREANPGRARAACRAWREAYPDRARAATRAWQQSNPEKVRAYNHNRRTRKLSGEGSHTAQDVRDLHKDQKGRCAYCKIEVGTNYHLDHIKPLAKGGSNNKENLQITCPSCNLRKGAKTHDEFLKFLKGLELQERSEYPLGQELEPLPQPLPDQPLP